MATHNLAMSSIAHPSATVPPDTDSTHPRDLWSLLPTEIKILVLEYAFIGPEWKHRDPRLYEEHDLTQEPQNSKYGPAATTLWVPGMRELAKEIFLRTKGCLIEANGYGTEKITELPPRHISCFLRGISLDLRFQLQDWNFLYDLSSGVLGFENLDYVEIFFNAHPEKEFVNIAELKSLANGIQDNPISFSVGCLYIEYHMWIGPPSTAYYTSLQHFENIRFLLFNHLLIIPKDGRHMAHQCEIEEEDNITCVTRTKRMCF